MLDIKQNHLELIKEILSVLPNTAEVWAFGSRIQGTANEFSDLDLVIVSNEKLEWRIFAKLKTEFEESNLPFKVDLLDWNTIPEHMQNNIKQKYEIIF